MILTTENGHKEKDDKPPLHRYVVVLVWTRNIKTVAGKEGYEIRMQKIGEQGAYIESENDEGAEWLARQMCENDSQFNFKTEALETADSWNFHAAQAVRMDL